MLGVVMPYWAKATVPEKLKGATLLGLSLFMTWYAVQVTVEFGHWQSGLTNTVQQLFQDMMGSRPEILQDVLQSYPALQNTMESNDLLSKILSVYPDTTSIVYDPSFASLFEQNPDLKELLGKNPSIEDIFMNVPDFAERVRQNPEVLEQLSAAKEMVAQKLTERPTTKDYLGRILDMAGGEFIKNMGGILSATFNVASHAVDTADVAQQSFGSAIKTAWNSKDLATIALKFTAMAIISYKSAQYLALRWRAWSTGYYTNKWLKCKAYLRLKNEFNNVDNPGQRIQEDPAKFTAGCVSLLTGVMNSGMQLFAFSGLLWGMGSVMGVPHGMFWTGLAYAGALTGLTIAAGHKLPEIQRNQQHREADLRGALDKVNNNAEVIAQNDAEDIENDLIKKRFRPVMTNSVREIGTQVKLIVVDFTAGNLSIPIPWVIGAFSVAAGTASMGTIQTINYAFNRVTSAMSFIVNRFEQLSQMKATGDRIYVFDKAIELANYVEEEKRQAAAVMKTEGSSKNPKPNGP